nr:kinesin-like protein KIF3A [Leptinotarsa decemlineata]
MLCQKIYSDDNVENIRVFIRVRPLKDEESTNRKSNIEVNNNTISFNKYGTIKTFKFSEIFDEHSSQLEVYRVVAVPIVEQVLQGYNGTIFAYGQSGTGKTYTMIGNIMDPELKGIVPNIFSHIFAQISLANKDLSYAVTVTYLEIYNEEIRDLLSETPERKLMMREKPGVGVFIKDLLGFTVHSLEAVTEILAKGNKNRATGCTKLNDNSSRSHAIFSLLLEKKNKVTNQSTFGKLNLVDLAGSERVNKTLATGDRLREAGKINLSLSVLGNVISALVDGKSSHIPYRNSKLNVMSIN